MPDLNPFALLPVAGVADTLPGGGRLRPRIDVSGIIASSAVFLRGGSADSVVPPRRIDAFRAAISALVRAREDFFGEDGDSGVGERGDSGSGRGI